MKILFIGGTGSVSTSSTLKMLELGHKLWVLTRGSRDHRLPAGVHRIRGDAYQPDADTERTLANTEWDCVVNWTVYSNAHAETDIARFRHNARHYVYISSTSVYGSVGAGERITESCPYIDGHWMYSAAKIEAERRFLAAMADGFPATIVRPGHTYDDFTVPTNIQGYGYGLIQAIERGGRVLLHDDGESAWTLTHSRDFAAGLAGLLGKAEAIGRTVHITSPFSHTWNEIFSIFEEVLGRQAKRVYVPSGEILAASRKVGEPIVYDKALRRVFDTTQICNLVPGFSPEIDFATGLARVVRWHRDHPAQIHVNTDLERELDGLLHSTEAAWARTS